MSAGPPTPPEGVHVANSGFNDYVKLNRVARENLLEQLDVAAGAAKPKQSARRTDQRFPFRLANIPVLIAQADGMVGRFLVVTRNISTGGVSFVHGSYIHVGSRCQLTLPSVHKELVVLKGTTVSCRHLKGMLHEVGVRFDKKIELERFNVEQDVAQEDEASVELPTLTGHALLVMSSGAAEEQNIATALHTAGMSLAPAQSLEQAIEQLKRLPTDILIYDARITKPTPAEAVKTFRAASFGGLLVALDPNADRRTTDEDGFDVISPSPSAARLLGAIARELEARANPEPPAEAEPQSQEPGGDADAPETPSKAA